MNFKKWVKSIQTAGYNGGRTVSKLHSLDLTDNGFQIIFVLQHSQKHVIKLIIFHAGPTFNLKLMIEINYDSLLYEF